MADNIAIVIPARRASTRLPDKMLAEIAGEAMVVHVWRRCVEADVGPVYVATDDAEIADTIRAEGGDCVGTSSDHASGTDRVREAVDLVDANGEYDIVVNCQGDIPTIPPAYVWRAIEALKGDSDIATLAAPVGASGGADSPRVAVDAEGNALYFTRAPIAEGHPHMGIYAYRRAALARFCELPRGRLERAESLEQLRALESGMRIGVGLVPEMVRGVDTAEDLAAVRRALQTPTA